MHGNEIIYALICINNHVLSCLFRMLSLSNSTHMMSMADPMAIGVETLKTDSGCSLEQEFTELIHMDR